jgi:hypothetical protein
MRYLIIFALAPVAVAAFGQVQPPTPPAQIRPVPVVPPNNNTRPQPVLPPTPLYQMNDVAKSLNLTPDQITRLNALSDKTVADYRDKYVTLGGVPAADQYAKATELNRNYNDAWFTGANQIFNDNQRARYQQYQYQYGGFDAFTNPDVQKKLNLSADQIASLRSNWDWNRQQLDEINRVGIADKEKGQKAYAEYWLLRQQRMNQYLTPDQQKVWTQLTGDPYTFQPVFPNR